MKIKEYKLLQSQNFTVLEKEVNKYIKLGFSTSGGLAVNTCAQPMGPGDYMYIYYQAMVKYEEETLEENHIIKIDINDPKNHKAVDLILYKDRIYNYDPLTGERSKGYLTPGQQGTTEPLKSYHHDEPCIKYEEEPRSYSLDEKTGIKTPIDLKCGLSGDPGKINSINAETLEEKYIIKYEDLKSMREEVGLPDIIIKNDTDRPLICNASDFEKFRQAWESCKEPSTIIFNKKPEPFLDWQENRPDNKPKEGVEVIIKYKQPNNYISWTFSTDKIALTGQWLISCGKDMIIEKWAYITE